MRIILFNKRRSSEAALLRVETFQNRIDWKKMAHQEIVNSLQLVEKKLLDRLDMVQTQGKMNKRVPIVLTQDAQEAIQNLIKYKGDVGQENNKYVFGCGASGHLSPWHTINKHAKRAGCKEPSLISSTRLRKYIATTCQVGILTKHIHLI